MDSTLVNQISGAALQLGITAKEAFVWWLLTRIGVHLIWVGFAVFAVHRLTLLAGSVGRGQRLLALVAQKCGGHYSTTDSDIARACSVLDQHFVTKHGKS